MEGEWQIGLSASNWALPVSKTVGYAPDADGIVRCTWRKLELAPWFSHGYDKGLPKRARSGQLGQAHRGGRKLEE